MSAFVSRLVIILSVLAAYFWVSIPALSPFTLQAFAVAVIAFLVIKKISGGNVWAVHPKLFSIEVGLISFAVLLLVGGSGGAQSILFSVCYGLILLVVFMTNLVTSLVLLSMMLVFFAVLLHSPEPRDLANLLSLPGLLVIFLFAKAQYQQAERTKFQLAAEKTALDSYTGHYQQLLQFLNHFLKSKLLYLITLLEEPEHNYQAVRGQLSLIEVEIEKVLEKDQQKLAESLKPPVSSEPDTEASANEKTKLDGTEENKEENHVSA